MIKTIALFSAAATLVTLASVSAQAAKNNPKFQSELIKIACGIDHPAQPAASIPDVTGQINRKAN